VFFFIHKPSLPADYTIKRSRAQAVALKKALLQGGSHCDLANSVVGAIWLASQDACHDQQGTVVIGGADRLRAAGFEDVFIPQQSAEDFL